MIALPLESIKVLVNQLGMGVKFTKLFYPSGFLGLVVVRHSSCRPTYMPYLIRGGCTSNYIYLIDLYAMRVIGWFDVGTRVVESVRTIKGSVRVQFVDGGDVVLSLVELEGQYNLYSGFKNWDWDKRKKYEEYMKSVIERYKLLYSLYLSASSPVIPKGVKAFIKELLTTTENELSDLVSKYPIEFMVD